MKRKPQLDLELRRKVEVIQLALSIEKGLLVCSWTDPLSDPLKLTAFPYLVCFNFQTDASQALTATTEEKYRATLGNDTGP